jgi:hypothetical protein
VLWSLFGVVSLNVLKPLWRKALEENVHVLVVWSFALSLLEKYGQMYLYNCIFDML